MRKSLLLLITLSLASSVPAYGQDAEPSSDLPTVHAIPYDSELDTLNDEYGADAFRHSLDHPDSKYYVINDYYNMTSGDSLHILSNFETSQQTTEYTCGCVAALMVLNYYGNHDYNEIEICQLAGTDTSKGTSPEGLVDFFTSIGWDATYHADTDYYFTTIEECEAFFIEQLDNGTPVMVDWADWAGHWQVLIGLDTCNTGNPYDDVLIMADPYDVTDHYQDGYYTVPFGRFFSMWCEGPCAQKVEPYQQPFVVAVPTEWQGTQNTDNLCRGKRWQDPDASHTVFESGIPIDMVGSHRKSPPNNGKIRFHGSSVLKQI